MNKIKPYLLIAPSTILLVFIMGVGVLNCVLQGLGYFPQIGLDNITFDYYKQVLTNKEFIQSLMLSLKTAFLSSAISVIIGLVFAYFLSKGRFSKIKYFLINLPIIVPHIVVVLFIFTIFSKTGILSRILFNLGVIKDSSEFLTLVNDKAGIGIILVYIYKGTPFIAITVYNILRNIDDKLEYVAKNLGANNFQTFRYVILPQIMPSLISSFIILFAFSFGSFEVPYLIGTTNPSALPVSAYINYISIDLINQRPIAMAMNTIIALISFVLLIIYNSLFNKINRYKKQE